MLEKKLLDRFIRYTKIWTTSDSDKADKGIIPSTEIQRAFAQQLADELKNLGLSEVQLTDHAYVCARLPATKGYEKAPSIGLSAHMDTSPAVSGKDVQPQIIKNYDGKPIKLKEGVVLDPALDPQLKTAIGETIITTDGTTLLGADDKAGIAEIITAIEYLLAHPEIPHGQIELLFSPDEETGHGMDKVPLEWFNSKQFYTLDGGHVGEIEVECFTAYKAEIHFTGKSKHPGTARPDMVNAVTMAAAFVSFLPQNESPEATDGYLGFYAPMKIEGEVEKASVSLILRDFDTEEMNRRIETVKHIAKSIEHKFPGGKADVIITQQYLNMKKKMDEHPEVVEILVEAVRNAGLTPVFKPIRGGTDGSRLTELGYPTPNIFTGGHNYHSRSEWAALSQMVAATKTVLELISLWSKKHV